VKREGFTKRLNIARRSEKENNVDEHETYVHSKWEKAWEPIVQRGLRGVEIWIEGSHTYHFHAPNRPAAWQHAHDFTLAREEQIRGRVLDCEVLAHFVEDQNGSYQGKAFERVLAREQAALAELKRGMK
jgi:hypothetical protein